MELHQLRQCIKERSAAMASGIPQLAGWHCQSINELVCRAHAVCGLEDSAMDTEDAEYYESAEEEVDGREEPDEGRGSRAEHHLEEFREQPEG